MRLLLNLIRWLFALLWRPVDALRTRARRRAARTTPRWLLLPLEGALVDLPTPAPRYAGVFRRERPLVLFELDEVLREAATDPAISGVICRLGELSAGWATLWELRRMLLRFREQGKKVIFYFDQLSNRSYWLASCADEILVAPEGTIRLLGLRAEVTFFRRLFDRLGVMPDFLRVGRYKSFAEAYTEPEMSPAMNESLSAVIDDLSTLMIEDIAEGRRLAPEAVRDLIDRGPYTAREAKEVGLVDATLYPDEIKDRLKVGEREPVWIPMGAYARRHYRRKWLYAPLRGRPQVVVVAARGPIVDQEGGQAAISPESIDARRYVRLLNALKEDDRVRGVVLRVNSPGGSALASDLLWRAVSQLQEAKPVVVSMGDTAASGGYYLAAAAGRILATPATLTGSIGVVAGKFSLGPLYERLGVKKVAIERGRHAGMDADSRPFSVSERERLQVSMDSLYRTFVEKVRDGRRLEHDAAEAAAQGRVWSGRQGRQLGLVDALGGLSEALAELRERVSGPRGLDTVLVAPRAGLSLRRLWAMQATQAVPAALEPLVRAISTWAAFAGREGQVMAILPFELDIR